MSDRLLSVCPTLDLNHDTIYTSPDDDGLDQFQTFIREYYHHSHFVRDEPRANYVAPDTLTLQPRLFMQAQAEYVENNQDRLNEQYERIGAFVMKWFNQALQTPNGVSMNSIGDSGFIALRHLFDGRTGESNERPSVMKCVDPQTMILRLSGMFNTQTLTRIDRAQLTHALDVSDVYQEIAAATVGTAFETEGEVPNIDPELYNVLVPAANLTAARVQHVIAGGDVQVVIQDEAGNRYTASTAAKVNEDRSSWKSRVVPETRIVDYSTAQNYLAYIYQNAQQHAKTSV